jgi:ribosomal protein S18 acetylase RimI-like enzyme
MKQKTLSIFYLEIGAEQAILGANPDIAGLRIERLAVPTPAFNRFMYQAVGGEWFWIDKSNWSEQEWLDYVQQDTLQTWGAWLNDTPCGYFELERKGTERIEIAYLGVLKDFFGQGLGRKLLIEALNRARQQGGQKITVNTCSLDHPAALANYQARGMIITREEKIMLLFPDQPPSQESG